MAHYFRRRRYCRFTEEGIEEVDYKDIAGHQSKVSTPIIHSDKTCTLYCAAALQWQSL